PQSPATAWLPTAGAARPERSSGSGRRNLARFEKFADHLGRISNVGLERRADRLHVVALQRLDQLAVVILAGCEADLGDAQVEMRARLKPERFDHLHGDWHARRLVEGEMQFLVF